ncbi:hypothetical protein SAMN04488055_5464 [Chitinophaga niabensis]|uniref:Uncharacterized protein n=1 Tax=Chitinophaga niabensis TaxID=536979 RepID=A0A1N6KAY5_9BACT|nr:hypothetical protein SAMN04488055_5464 [Chitinophaga niabensis]
MVELEEISPYGIYYLDKKPIQLLEEHFRGNILQLAESLVPVPIDPIQLWRLNFHHQPNTGACSKIWKECKVIITPAKHGWTIQFPGIPNAGQIFYIHQVQRLWYAHFQEHLWLPKKTKPTPPKSLIVEPVVISEKIIHRNRTYMNHTTIHPEDQPYYLSWDSRLLLRSSDFAIWRVSEKSPLFSHAGRNWGLSLLHGRAVEEDRIHAGKWLRAFLSS